jgi:hypothetical protein
MNTTAWITLGTLAAIAAGLRIYALGHRRGLDTASGRGPSQSYKAERKDYR